MSMTARFRVFPLAAALCAALSVAACTNDKDLADASGFAGGANTPGSAQDFVVNIGDRVFFESDSTDLTPTATATPTETPTETPTPTETASPETPLTAADVFISEIQPDNGVVSGGTTTGPVNSESS